MQGEVRAYVDFEVLYSLGLYRQQPFNVTQNLNMNNTLMVLINIMVSPEKMMSLKYSLLAAGIDIFCL